MRSSTDKCADRRISLPVLLHYKHLEGVIRLSFLPSDEIRITSSESVPQKDSRKKAKAAAGSRVDETIQLLNNPSRNLRGRR
jgi:hypothetical protein